MYGDGGAVRAGANVRVTERFESLCGSELLPGQTGTVRRFDGDGRAEIDFPHETRGNDAVSPADF
eukprot:gene17805-23387_t